jgi:hypothetical protein
MIPDVISRCLSMSVYICLAASLAPAWAAERLPVNLLKPLLLLAIERGESHGVLIGESAAFLAGRFDSSAPVEIDVEAVKLLPQSGCKRLKVTTRQNAVREAPQKAPVPKELIYQVSYCRDGRFPETQ